MSESNDLSSFEVHYRNINLGSYVWMIEMRFPDLCRLRCGSSRVQPPCWTNEKPAIPRPGFICTLTSWCVVGGPRSAEILYLNHRC